MTVLKQANLRLCSNLFLSSFVLQVSSKMNALGRVGWLVIPLVKGSKKNVCFCFIHIVGLKVIILFVLKLYEVIFAQFYGHWGNERYYFLLLQQQGKIKLMKEKFCLSSVASFKQINGSSVNNSKTKQTFSFSKTPRFDSIRPVCEKSTYGGDFMQHKVSGASIGYGSKYDFTKTSTISPACTKYNWTSEFQQNVKRHRGSSVGLSRDVVSFNQYISKQAIKTPASTKYQYEKYDKFRSPSYSLRQKTMLKDRSMTIDPELSNPGPGTYHQPKDRKVSKFAQIAYGTSKSDRFLSAVNGIPGVGQYKNTESISGQGKYINSKHIGGTQAKFGKSSRSTFLDQTVKSQKAKPGPGFYKAPSQFGQYDGEVYMNTTALSKFSRK